MDIEYDTFTGAFLTKVTEYRFVHLFEEDRNALTDSYMKRALAQFCNECAVVVDAYDDEDRIVAFHDGLTMVQVDDIIDIVSDGMLVEWLKPYVYKQENLENMLNTQDYTAYSPAELTHRVHEVYNTCRVNFTQRMREYSYVHGDLTVLHL